jgi:putative component of membrane protein insertase Oxa1/YidC/SpoIIIJ protein YidD
MSMCIANADDSTVFSGEPQATPLWPARLAAAAIRGYQRWISPHKGFVCARRSLHGGQSCSEFARQAILDCGVLAAIPDIRNQFRACRAAAQAIRRHRASERDAAEMTSGQSDQMARGRNTNRSLEERMHEDTEDKRRRLNELPGSESESSNCSEWLFAGQSACNIADSCGWR